jgi:hypothetical protein
VWYVNRFETGGGGMQRLSRAVQHVRHMKHYLYMSLHPALTLLEDLGDQE